MSDTANDKGAYRVHWRQFAAACLLVAGGQGLIFNSIANYITPIMYVTGQGQAVVGAAVSLGALIMMVLLAFVGKILKKFNLKKILIVCAIASMLCFIGIGFIQSIGLFFVLYPLCTALGAIPAFVTGPMLVTNWFEKKKGLLTGLMMVCGNIAAVIGSLVAGLLLGGEPYNTMLAFSVMGVIAMVFMLIGASMAVIHPATMGLRPYGAEEAAKPENAEDVAGISSKKALKSPAFIFLFIIVFLLICCASFSTLMSNFANVTYGFTNAQGSIVISLFMIGSTIGGLIWGILDDRIGVLTTTVIGFICIILGIIGMAFLSSTFPMLLSCACVFGLGCSSAGTQQAMLCSRFFGQKEYGAIFSKVQMAQALGGLVSVVAIGAVAQATGSYIPALIGMAVLMVLAVIMLFMAVASAKKLWQAEGLEAPKM